MPFEHIGADTGLIGIYGEHRLHNGMWTLCKARKKTACAVSGDEISRGESVYRPISNGKFRMQRIKARCIQTKEDE